MARCRETSVLGKVNGVRVDLYGSLAKTGRGHGTDRAVVFGLMGLDPVSCDTNALPGLIEKVRSEKVVHIPGRGTIPFDPDRCIFFHPETTLPYHPNGLTFTAELTDGRAVSETYFSIGGGFIAQEGCDPSGPSAVSLPMPIDTADDLLRHCREHSLSIPEVVRTNDRAWRTDAEIDQGLQLIYRTMLECVGRGCRTEGKLPGGLNVVRRAPSVGRSLLVDGLGDDPDFWLEEVRRSGGDFQRVIKWVSCFALAVNEENAAYGRVVTAPTNGAAGVIPAVLLYYRCFCESSDAGVIDFLLTAGEIGSIFKKGATISAAVGGCQAEIGVSSAMAAAALAHCLGASPEQALMAAEIAMEHHLGLTCDPIGGLVQIPCIERNTMGAVKAITAANLSLDSDPSHAKVSLDDVIRSMWATAQDMSAKYKETSEGGLAVQIPVNVIEC